MPHRLQMNWTDITNTASDNLINHNLSPSSYLELLFWKNWPDVVLFALTRFTVALNNLTKLPRRDNCHWINDDGIRKRHNLPSSLTYMKVISGGHFYTWTERGTARVKHGGCSESSHASAHYRTQVNDNGTRIATAHVLFHLKLVRELESCRSVTVLFSPSLSLMLRSRTHGRADPAVVHSSNGCAAFNSPAWTPPAPPDTWMSAESAWFRRCFVVVHCSPTS